MTDNNDNDRLYRYLFKQRAVRGEWVRLNQTFTQTLNTHHYPKAVQNLLGEMLVATSLLTATMKFEGDITVQIQGDGALSLAVVNGNHRQQLRAVAKVNATIAEEANLHQMVGNGVLIISIQPEKGERYQGIISLDYPTLTECLESYFNRSEQLPTQLTIRVGEWHNQPVAAGMLLQTLPNADQELTDFEHLATLCETTKADEIFSLSAEALLFRLYHEEVVEIYPPQQTAFKCSCSAEKSGMALLLLDEPARQNLLQEKQGVIDIQCECCGMQYYFDEKTLTALQHATTKG